MVRERMKLPSMTRPTSRAKTCSTSVRSAGRNTEIPSSCNNAANPSNWSATSACAGNDPWAKWNLEVGSKAESKVCSGPILRPCPTTTASSCPHSLGMLSSISGMSCQCGLGHPVQAILLTGGSFLTGGVRYCGRTKSIHLTVIQRLRHSRGVHDFSHRGDHLPPFVEPTYSVSTRRV